MDCVTIKDAAPSCCTWAGWNKVCLAIAGLSAKVFQSFGYFLGRAIESILVKRLAALLCGGDKSSQERDIQAAKAYWKEYKDHG
ncbi:hypothetical protein SAMN05216414_11463 [Nitrosovibrio sp. Nv17]|nr:hypothetical protein SAMN05216414_11463 [Nitrosovibrio sp. Nv17]